MLLCRPVIKAVMNTITETPTAMPTRIKAVWLRPSRRNFSAMFHFLFALPRVVFLTAPLAFLLLGHSVIAASPLAIIAYAGLNMAGIDGIRPLVGKVVDGSPAAQAGFRPGDEWVSIDDRPVHSWDEHRLYLYEKAIDRATVHFVVRDASGVPQERLLNLGSLTTAEVGAALLERDIGLTPALPEIATIRSPTAIPTRSAGPPASRVPTTGSISGSAGVRPMSRSSSAAPTSAVASEPRSRTRSCGTPLASRTTK